MQGISNSLRQRLKVRPEPQVHPDADLLTAYTEQALPAKERNQVVQHLAECSYCREIVSLSLPEVQALPVALQAAGRSRWWIPAYRWAAVAATVAIAATLVVEKPWRSHFERPAPTTTLSDNAQPASSEKPSVATPAASQPETGTPASVQTGNTIQPDRKETASAAKASRKPDAAEGSLAREEHGRRPNETVEVGSSAGVVGGVVGGSRQAPRLMAPMAAPPPPPQPVPVLQAQAAPVTDSSSVAKDVPHDFVNRVIVSNAAADVSSVQPLPDAPTIKEAESDQYAARKQDPRRLRQEALAASEMNVPVVQPTTATDQAPSAAGTNLAKSGGFAYGLKSGLTKAVNTTVATVKRAASAKSSSSPASLGFAAPSAISAADADQQTAKRASREIHWRVTPEGRLQRSTDVGQWHQVVTQNPDIQFKVVQPHGSEVWAGGNNGTLIHSWNAGVNWSQLNVPDSSSSDITGIAIDGDNVQVKTSNGQTFVTNDHGKTWVPLEQNPQ